MCKVVSLLKCKIVNLLRSDLIQMLNKNNIKYATGDQPVYTCNIL